MSRMKQENCVDWGRVIRSIEAVARARSRSLENYFSLKITDPFESRRVAWPRVAMLRFALGREGPRLRKLIKRSLFPRSLTESRAPRNKKPAPRWNHRTREIIIRIFLVNVSPSRASLPRAVLRAEADRQGSSSRSFGLFEGTETKCRSQTHIDEHRQPSCRLNNVSILCYYRFGTDYVKRLRYHR